MLRLTPPVSHGLGLAAAILLATGSAQATTLYDTTLASPNQAPAASGNSTSTSNSSWFNGGGNPQGGFVVDTENGIELGMRAKQRGQTPIYWTSGDVYTVPTGTAATPARAIWNYEFSIDVNPGGTGGNTLGTMVGAGDQFTLTVTDAQGHTATVNPLTNWGDDTGYGSGAGDGSATPPSTMSGKDSPEKPNDWAVQNSENMSFSDSPLNSVFDPWIADTYTFVLTVTNAGGGVLASDTMVVDAVPEPATLSLLAAGCLGLLGLRRRRRNLFGA